MDNKYCIFLHCNCKISSQLLRGVSPMLCVPQHSLLRKLQLLFTYNETPLSVRMRAKNDFYTDCCLATLGCSRSSSSVWTAPKKEKQN